MSGKERVSELSIKNTKEQILAAYNQALSLLNTKQQYNPEDQKKKQEKTSLVESTSKISTESILTDLNALKLKIIKQIEGLSESLLNESAQLHNIRESIAIEQQHLEELYQIKENANSLAALIRANTDEKEKFHLNLTQELNALNENIKTKTDEWVKKQEQLEKDYKERKEVLEKQRLREEEEYRYNQGLERRKETDDYLTKKVALEKELEDKKLEFLQREKDISSKEILLQDLQTKVDQFPEITKIAITSAEEKLRLELEQTHQFNITLKAKEYETESKLAQQKISHLENRIKEQDAQIRDYSQKLNDASSQVQAIASKALETSMQRIYTNNTEEKSK